MTHWKRISAVALAALAVSIGGAQAFEESHVSQPEGPVDPTHRSRSVASRHSTRRNLGGSASRRH